MNYTPHSNPMDALEDLIEQRILSLPITEWSWQEVKVIDPERNIHIYAPNTQPFNNASVHLKFFDHCGESGLRIIDFEDSTMNIYLLSDDISAYGQKIHALKCIDAPDEYTMGLRRLLERSL
jgi:hypothetical protein